LQHETKKALLCVVLIYGTDLLVFTREQMQVQYIRTVFANGYDSLPAATELNN